MKDPRESSMNPEAGTEGTSFASSLEADLVDEASDESFPCSDPPTFTSLHAGAPAPTVGVDESVARPPTRSSARLSRPQGLLLVVLVVGVTTSAALLLRYLMGMAARRSYRGALTRAGIALALMRAARGVPHAEASR